MYKINIQGLSANKMWKGRRFKSQAYKDYETELWYLLPNKVRPTGKLHLIIEFGFSNRMSDIDNCLKSFLDVLQLKYIFNDNMIYKLEVEKKVVKKNKDYIKFKIKQYEQ